MKRKYIKRIFIAFILVVITPVILAILFENGINDFINYKDNLYQYVCFYSTLNTKKVSEDKDKLLRDKLLIEIKEKEKSNGEILTEILTKNIIKGITFNKLNEELWIDFPSDIDCKKAYESVQLFLQDIQKIDSKGFLNTTNLNDIPVISNFINYFTQDEKYISGNKVADSYKWIFNVLMVCLYEYSLKLMYKIENELEPDSDLLADFKTLSRNIFSKIDPSLRIKMQKRGVSVIQNVYTGFDTEYKNKDIKFNELISVQLAVNTKTLLKIPKYSEYELSTLNTLTGEEYKIDVSNEKDFNFFMIERTLNRCINEIRFLTYKKNDVSISILIEGLQRLNIPFIEKGDAFVFSFPRSSIQPFIYYNNGEGYTFEEMINQSNLIGEPYLKMDNERITELLKRISSLEIFNNREDEGNLDWIENANQYNDYKVLDTIEYKNIPNEVVVVKVKKTTRSSSTSFTEDKVSVTKIHNNYFIAHLTNADLSILNDFETLKEDLNIVNGSFVTLGKPLVKPIVIGKPKVKQIVTGKPKVIVEPIGEPKGEPKVIGATYVIIRDTKLLAPAGHKTLASIGSLYGQGYEKISLTKEQIENMDLLLKEDKHLFDTYAIKDAIIPLIHGNYMEDFNFKLNEIGIPVTLSSLGSTYVKEKWRQMGYKGYQISKKHLLGDVSATLTPKGLLSTEKTGLKLSYYIGNYKGGRNESFMYGVDDEIKLFDYDLTSAYTTAMACLGNPDYNKGRMISLKEFQKMSFNEILYSYIIMTAKFKFKQTTKYPSIPCYVDETTTVYPLEGEGILTGPEYLLAKNQKCDLKISDIYYIPFEKNKEGEIINRPFKSIIDEIQSKRREYPKGSINNLLYKEMGNSIYGSVVRGMSDKRKFDIKTGRTLRMEAGYLSNPVIASWITAFIRSVIGECLENISKLKGKIVSVTTDGFITDIENLEFKITELYKSRDDSLLKEYKKIRYELSRDDSGLEIKKDGLGIETWTTRGQLGKESGIKATTGFQAKNYTLEELYNLFKETFKKEDKSLEYIQFSLRSALDIYKDGGHVTPVYKDQKFRLQFDNRRLIILPKEYENTIDFSNILLDSNPLPNKEFCKTLRYLSKIHKQSLYNKNTSISSGNKYKNYTDLAVRNFIKGLLSNPQKYNLSAEVSSYSEIIDFVKGFDDKIKVSKDSISKLKNRKMIFKTVPRTKETLEFVKYVKEKYKTFDEKDFLA